MRAPFDILRGVAILALALLAACGGTDLTLRRSPELEGLGHGGYRIAIMPFEVSADEDGFITESLAPLGALLKLEGVSDDAPPLEQAATVMRRAVAGHLTSGPMQVAELWVTDTELAHHDISPEEARDPDNAARIAEILDVQGVLYGDIFRWNRSYYLVEARQTVGLRLRLVEGLTREELFFSERSETRAAGVTGGPTGQVSALTSPIKGLSGSTLVKLARSVAYGGAMDLSGGDLSEQLSVEEARGDVPRISFASVISNGEAGRYATGEALRVVAVGTADQQVTFDIGRFATSIPMTQSSVDDGPRGARGTYVGSYVLQPGDVAANLPVYVTIRSPEGRSVSSVHRVNVPEAVNLEASNS